MLSFSIFVLIIPNTFAESVPEWVKNTAGWWATDQISETEFVNAVEFLVKENIIQVNVSQTSETSDGVPEWVKNTAGWWATDQISETEFVNAIKFLIESGLINISSYNCDQSEDRDRNGVPDIIETAPVLSGLDTSLLVLDDRKFTDKNWSNCYFPKDLSHYTFINVDLSYSDFSDSKLFNTMFDQVNLQGADLSNIDIRGSVFYSSNLSHTNFENADFSTDNWEKPFVVITYNYVSDYVTITFQCYYKPCWYQSHLQNYNTNNVFIHKYLKDNQHEIEELGRGQTVQNLNRDRLYDYKIKYPLPDIQEQCIQIYQDKEQFIRSIDDKIESEKKYINDLKNLTKDIIYSYC